MKRIAIRILGILFLLPGFIFDMCIGFTTLSNNAGSTTHVDNKFEVWAFGIVPDILQVPFMISVFICVIPTFIVYTVGTLLTLIGLMYLVNGLIGSLVSIPFTGKIQWRTLSSFAD